jgi:hypothetical protein
MGIKYTLAVGENGEVSGTTEDQSVFDQVVEGATLPLQITASSNEVVSKKTAAYSVLGFSGSAFFLGEAFGHKRAREGKQSFVPVFRG